MTLTETIQIWRDDKQVHKYINEKFVELVNADEKLKAYRDWIEAKIFGFGERSFLWMWKILVDEMPVGFRFLELGVFRGQILGLIRMLSPTAIITGVTPLDSTGGHWESDYEADIKMLHNVFELKQPFIINGLSTSVEVIKKSAGLYDIVYIDGGHEYETVRQDIANYSIMVKPGGYLVIDDCSNKYNLPLGYFKGIETVSRAVDEVLPNETFTEIFSVVHNRIFKRNN